MAVIMINGREFPAPDIGGNLVVATNVSDGKNANGEFVGQLDAINISLIPCSGRCWMLRRGLRCYRNLINLW